MKFFFSILTILLLLTNSADAQFCGNPNNNFCPNNYFQNGDFETVNGNPNAVNHQDINLVTGWTAIWGGNVNNVSLADLHCWGGTNSTGTQDPSPPSGVYAGMWIENRPNTNNNIATFREGMYNRLTRSVLQNTGTYTFTFNISNAMVARTQGNLPHSIGIYGVNNNGNIPANAPTGSNANPTNINLWGGSANVVLLGTITTPTPFTNNWISQNITFNTTAASGFPQQITHIMVTANDNARPATYRKVYVNFDDFCLVCLEAEAEFSMPTEICLGEELIIDGTASSNEDSYFWSIEESDINGNRPNPSSEVSGWVNNQQVGIINYSSLYASKGKQFECDKYYRIKLAVRNRCTTWNEKVQKIYFKYPPKANAGNDICCSDIQSQVDIGGNVISPDYKYEWFPKNGLSTPNMPGTFVDCSDDDIKEFDCFLYTLRVTDRNNGCQVEDQVNVFFGKPKISTEIIKGGCCNNHTLKVITDGCHNEILWSTGETSSSITIPKRNAIYNVTVSNSCGSSTEQITIEEGDYFTGEFPPIKYNTKILPSQNLVIEEWGKARNQAPAYNACGYRLYLFNRWDQWEIVSEGTTENGFYNGEIIWDKTFRGRKVSAGAYTLKLELKNCTIRNWEVNQRRNGIRYHCKRWCAKFPDFWNKRCCELDFNRPYNVELIEKTITVTVD